MVGFFCLKMAVIMMIAIIFICYFFLSQVSNL